MNVKGTRRKNQVVNIFEQQEMLAKAEEIRSSLKASTWRELETNGKVDKNDKLTFISEIARMEEMEAMEAELNKPVNTPVTNRPMGGTNPQEKKTGRASDEYRDAIIRNTRS